MNAYAAQPLPSPAAGPALRLTPSSARLSNSAPQLAFNIDGSGVAAAEVFLATDPQLFRTAVANGSASLHSSRSDIGLIRLSDGGPGVYVVPARVLQRFAGASPAPRRLYYAGVGFARGDGAPVVADPPLERPELARFVEIDAGFGGTTLSHLLGDGFGQPRALSIAMTAPGAAGPILRRTPEAAVDVVERPARPAYRDSDAPSAARPATPPAPAARPAPAAGGSGGYRDDDLAPTIGRIGALFDGSQRPAGAGGLREGARQVLNSGAVDPLLDAATSDPQARGVLDGMIGFGRQIFGLEAQTPPQPLTDETRRKVVEVVAGLDGGRPRYDAMNLDGEFRGRFGPDHPYHRRAHAGLGFGIAQFGQDSGSLGQLLQAMRARDPEAFGRIFGPSADALVAMTTATGPDGPASPDGRSARVQPLDGADLWEEPWIARFKAAAAHPPFQAAQNQLASDLFLEPALPLLRQLGLATERGLAFAYDRAAHMGSTAANSFLVNGVGVAPTDAQRAEALRAVSGGEGLEAYQRARGLSPTGTWSVETKAALVADLRALGPGAAPVETPAYPEMLDRLVAAARGQPWAGRLERLRAHPDLADAPFTE